MSVPIKQTPAGEIMESVIIKGDLSKLTADERVRYYNETCKSIGLNPLTKPLEYIILNNRLTLYARRDAADQLRKINGISVEIVSQEQHDGLLSIHVRAKDHTGRSDEDLGVVNFPETLRGEARANAILKAVTKAKRRVTLSISGLGFLDETEIEDIPAAAKKPAKPAPNVLLHDPKTGEITEPKQVDVSAADPAMVADAASASQESEVGAVLCVEDMAREAAMHGEKVFQTYYNARTGQEKMRINVIGDELRELMNEAKRGKNGSETD